MQCYDLVLDSLAVFEEQVIKDSAPVGPPKAASNDDADTVRNHAFELAFASEDEMFHSALYEWFISRSLADELLEVTPPRHLSSNETFIELHCLVTAYIPRGSSQKGASDSPKIPAAMAVLCKGWPTITSCRGAQHFGRVDHVSVSSSSDRRC